MRLAEIIGLRPQPAAGLLVTLTRRCPLSCAHCSTGSGPASAERPDPGDLRRFVASFTGRDRPEVMMLTGGEPLLMPGLVRDLALSAREKGTRTAVLSGMFFARARTVPKAVLRAAASVDHFSASLDLHHEREVPREKVFAALRELSATGTRVSLHLTGTGPDDPYLAEATAAVDREFGGTLPVLVNEIRAFGRAAAWARPARAVRTDDGAAPAPCAMAAWPVVAFDGTVIACCNQHAVDRRPVPPHLRLGHVAEDTWGTVRARALDSPLLRMVRTVGPLHLRARHAPNEPPAASYCDACHQLSALPGAVAAAERTASGAAGALLDLTVSRGRSAHGATALVRAHGCAPYAAWVERPAPGGPEAVR
ncbi:radical SAM protein [Streptomyces sp. TP-A0874]|uniref:radical SAM protein n=1 Tax=Streptomyces sp. TP-A0874 TaxID=549819 RepID=UPI000853A0C2|nr:radical SAM protein [Streptomyces sp. TP-A0874]